MMEHAKQRPLYVCAIWLLQVILMENMINLCAWNMRALPSSRSYIETLSQGSDVIILSEHRLYQCELFKLEEYLPGFSVYAKASHDLKQGDVLHKPGHCGMLIAWRSHLDVVVTKVKVNSDRICGIKLSNCGEHNTDLYIFGVYMPHQNCTISDFGDHLAQLEDAVNKSSKFGEVVILGDFNCHFGDELGSRFWGKTTRNARQMSKMFERNGLVILDKDSNCTGPTYTFNVDGVGSSYVDHIVVSKPLTSCIVSCHVEEDDLANTSDHLPVCCTVELSAVVSRVPVKQQSSVKWKKLYMQI